ncbi:hypothetical protein PENSPDRAFT_693679 [Peniophora sp. CONT]|nr:hypothetical protein PENSPDRAFT_693679 [Peniophora sp. CONT]
MSTPRSADELFTNMDADIIVRSSDTVDFKVHKVLLTKLFHSFQDMLGAPMVGAGNAQTTHEGLPVVPLTETSEVLEHLLRLLYPVPFPDLSGNWDALLSLCVAMDKYSAKFYPLAIAHALLQAAKSPGGPGPGSVYVLACRHPSLNDLLLDVAKLSLRHTPSLDVVPKELFSGMSAIQYHALIDYQNRCRKAAEDATLPNTIVEWLPLEDLPGSYPLSQSTRPCPCYKSRLIGFEWDVGPAQGENDVEEYRMECSGHLMGWLSNYLDGIRSGFKTDISGSVVSRSDSVAAAITEALKCPTCSKSEVTRMVSFVEKLAERVDEQIDAVPFHDA